MLADTKHALRQRTLPSRQGDSTENNQLYFVLAPARAAAIGSNIKNFTESETGPIHALCLAVRDPLFNLDYRMF